MMPVTRHYVDVGGRLAHYRRAGHGPPVVLLHASPRSSVELLPLIELLPDSVTVFALDTPGYGQSDPLPLARPTLDDYADALRDTMAALGIMRAPVHGTHTGASIAYVLALRHPDACALALLDGFPVFNALEREEALASYLPPFRPAVDGTHLTWLWSRVRDQTMFFPWYRRGMGARLHLPPVPAAGLHAIALDVLRAGDGYRTAYAAAFSSRPLETVARLRAPVLFGSRLDDVLLSHLDRLPALPAGCEVERFPAARPAYAVALHRHMLASGTGNAPAPAQAGLPQGRVGRAYLDFPGAQMHVRGVLGGGGKPLLLLHALPGSSLAWETELDRMAGQRPVAAPDLPGAGDSEEWPESGAEGVVSALVALCDRLGFGATDVSGTGTGAVLAHGLTRRDPARFALGTLMDLPRPDAVPPEVGLFAPNPVGAHLLAAWHHVRDAAILGGWEAREPVPFDALDADTLHAAAVELVKARSDPAGLIGELLATHRAD